MSDKSELTQVMHDYYLNKLPTGLQPKLNGIADGIISTVAGSNVDLILDFIEKVSRTTVDSATDEELNFIGKARLLNRFPNENTEQFRTRVKGAYEFWSKAGTLDGIKTALLQLGYNSSILERIDVNWSKFSVTIYPNTQTYDGSPAELNRILTIINDVKPAHCVLQQLNYIASGTAYGTGAKFGTSVKFGGVSSVLFVRP
jgi:Phage tail protein (Tail_P2_I)